jgi:phage portal protein BeeE
MGYTKAQPLKPEWLLATAEAEKYKLPDMSLYKNQAELYQRLSWVHIAITQLAQACSVQMLNVKHREGDKLIDIPNHPFEVLLDSPNPDRSRMEFIFDTVAWYKLTGNCYWWLNRPNENAAPAEMWVVPSNQITPVPDGKLYIKGYLYNPGDGSEIPLEPWEIMHFKSFNPNNRFVGLSPVEAIAVVATGDMEMQKTNTRLYGEEGGKLPSVLAFADSINDSDWDRIKK